MNASPVSTPNASHVPVEAQAVPAKRVKRSSWVVSLTGVCFIFGGLLAMQLRAIQQVQANRAQEIQGKEDTSKLVEQMRAKAQQAQISRDKTNEELNKIKITLANNGSLSNKEIATLNSQIKELQTVAGLNDITGTGVQIVLSDNPNAAKDAGDTAFLPGLVHDYDILQVVNELRAAKADAIGVHGAGGDTIRVTGYTPIRCVGPVIYINWEPVAAPFTIEAVGEPKTLRSALEMPNGIVDNLKNNGAVGVKVASINSLTLPKSTTGAPQLRTAKATP